MPSKDETARSDGEDDRPVIGHFFADCGVEGEALATYGEVVRFSIDPRPAEHDTALEVDLMETTPATKVDLGLFHPKCTKWANMTSISGNAEEHPNMIPRARELAEELCDEWVIENVPKAPLNDPVVLSGKMFGLPIEYERAFETSFQVRQPPRHQTLDTETSTFFYSGKDTSWWRSIKGIRGDYPKEHIAKNCLPLPYVHWLGRQWLEATGRAEGVTDYSEYDKRKTTERRKVENHSLEGFAHGE